MAFATSNVVRENLGTLNMVRGSWTGDVTDTANGTITGSGHALSSFFMTNNTTCPENVVLSRIDNSDGTWTVTIPNVDTVTAGTFEITFK